MQTSQENFTTIVYAKFGGLTECIMDNWEIVNRKAKARELVSSTSRRGARAVYPDEYPRDFGPRIAYAVS